MSSSFPRRACYNRRRACRRDPMAIAAAVRKWLHMLRQVVTGTVPDVSKEPCAVSIVEDLGDRATCI